MRLQVSDRGWQRLSGSLAALCLFCGLLLTLLISEVAKARALFYDSSP